MPINSFLYPGAKVTTAYEVANSCRFNDDDSAYMHKTCSSAFDTDRFTISVWCKRGALGIETRLVSCDDADGSDDDFLKFDANDNIEFTIYGSSSVVGRLITNAKYRDVSAWMNIVAVWDSANGTAGNRMRLYVNGTEVTSFSTDTNPSSGANATFGNTSHPIEIGRRGSNGTQYFDGYIAEVAVCDGQAYAASDFGEFDEDSPTIWKPKDVSGLTFGTSGFYLDFEDSGNLGNDKNGGTDLTEVNLAATDQSSDSPTNNFCVMNSIASQAGSNASNDVITFAEGNLDLSAISSESAVGTIGVAAGKWYWEVKVITTQDGIIIGGANQHFHLDAELGYESPSSATGAKIFGYYGSNGNSFIAVGDGTSQSYGSAINSNNNIIGVALDVDSADQTCTFYLNGTSQGSLDITNLGTGEYYFPACGNWSASNCAFSFNFGNPTFSISSGNSDGNGYGNFEYAVPSGYYALCTQNLAKYGG